MSDVQDRADDLWARYLAAGDVELAYRNSYRRSSRNRQPMARLAELHLEAEYTAAAEKFLTSAVRRADASWRSEHSVRYDWLLPSDGQILSRLTKSEQEHLRRWKARAGVRLSFGPLGPASWILRRSLPHAEQFRPLHEPRENDSALVQRLEMDRISRVWTSLSAVEQAVVKRSTRRSMLGVHLSTALLRSHFSSPITTYRIEEIGSPERRNYLYGLRPGDVYWSDRALSTRVLPTPLRNLGIVPTDLEDQDFATGDLSQAPSVMFELMTTRGIYIGGESLVPSGDEQELLIAPHSRWVVAGHADVVAQESESGPRLARRHMIQLWPAGPAAPAPTRNYQGLIEWVRTA